MCENSFSQNGNLRRHKLRVHENLKAFKCGTCNKTYAAKVDLNKHVMGIHKGIKYSCEICQKVYSKQRSLRKHEKNCHQI